MEESLMEDVEEIDTIIAELEISKGKGNLILCVVNSPAYRDRIIQTLRRRFLSKVIPAEKGELIIRILKEQDFGGADILIWVMPEEPTEDLLNTLNNFRELFYEVKIPNLMFYNQAFSESVIRKAPDFWRYRGNYYELREAERGIAFEAIETMGTPFSYQDKEDLLRRKRINEYLLEKVRDKEEKTKILSELGTIFYYLGKINKALKYYGKALKLDEELGSKEGIAADLVNIGIIHQTKGELDKALEYYRKALKLNEELGKKEGIATDLVNIGIIHKTKGELDKALEYYRKALQLDEELGSKEGIAADLGNIGNLYRIKGELDKALEYYGKALKKFRDIGSRIETARTLMSSGDVFVLKGEKDRALDCYSEAKGLAVGTSVFEEISKRIINIRSE
jgi:tetratricopeptide (TPR) repeat protein